ncbi:hypothetical protein BN59_02256 [Legionella massiliensis]|uniref:Vitamin B12 transport ATP-binding protein BacA n=1 Tax=Legionella massiliensis TaxID=1034943 RepID=A0A078KU52_9GAMM|nr:ATP-binding cassette domain-containing protein [Legionella massiliensis]CDZ77960.1 hypothetical protein BN59_02256 [Legionella massiliensis]CEE13698.1 Inner membrane ABC transporter ATP-binding protein YddA [Legionella massiliensis]
MSKKLNIIDFHEEEQEQTPEVPKSSWRNTLDLMTGYFIKSDQKFFAWLQLIGIILCVVGIVGLMLALTWWSAGFWAVLGAKVLAPFLMSMVEFTILVGALVGLHVLKNYLIGNLSVSWREWLTKNIINQLFDSENNYLELKRTYPEIDNIGERIQDGAKSFVELTLRLVTDFIRSALSLGLFAGTLWVVGGSLAIGMNIVIPGYLVWVALLIAIVATITTHFLGRSLAETNQQEESTEADLRQDLTVLSKDSEKISVEHAGEHYRESLISKTEDLATISKQKLKTQTKVVAFQNFYGQFSSILPTLLAAPLYFTGLIELAQIMEIGMAFSQVSSSLSWFVEAYEDLSRYRTAIARLTQLQYGLENAKIAPEHKAIVRTEKNKDAIKIKGLTITHPNKSSVDLIFRNLNLKINAGDKVVIKGASGIGKSTIFKAIAGVWKYGEGKITVPAGKTIDVLAQEPTLRKGSLRALLAYPKPARTYTLKKYTEVLRKVGGMEQFIPNLRDSKARDWSELSGGQQQKIALARVLLNKPDWVLLDEATSKLDEESEERVYRALNELKGTTVVSIAHRSTVEKYHSKIAFFSVDKEKTVTVNVKEQLIDQEARLQSC